MLGINASFLHVDYSKKIILLMLPIFVKFQHNFWYLDSVLFDSVHLLKNCIRETERAWC